MFVLVTLRIPYDSCAFVCVAVCSICLRAFCVITHVSNLAFMFAYFYCVIMRMNGLCVRFMGGEMFKVCCCC